MSLLLLGDPTSSLLANANPNHRLSHFFLLLLGRRSVSWTSSKSYFHDTYLLSTMSGIIVAVDVVLGAVGLYLVKSIFFSSPRQKGELPPGPKAKPLIGNLLDLPQGHEWLHWAKHKDLYGERELSLSTEPVFTYFYRPTEFHHSFRSAHDHCERCTNRFRSAGEKVFCLLRQANLDFRWRNVRITLSFYRKSLIGMLNCYVTGVVGRTL